MEQPLWQNLLNIAFIGWVVRRAAVVLAFGSEPQLLVGMYVALCIAGLIAGVLIWFRPRWVAAGLILLTVTFVATSLAETAIGHAPLASALVFSTFALVAAAVLVRLALRADSGDRAHTSTSVF